MKIINIVAILLFFNNCNAVREIRMIEDDFSNKNFSVKVADREDFKKNYETLYVRSDLSYKCDAEEATESFNSSGCSDVIVVEDNNNNKIIGSMQFTIIDDIQCSIDKLHINEQYRSKGLGSLLYEYIFAYSKLKYDVVYCEAMYWDYGRNYPALGAMLRAGGTLLDEGCGGDINGAYKIDFDQPTVYSSSSYTRKYDVLDGKYTENFVKFSKIVFNQHLSGKTLADDKAQEVIELYYTLTANSRNLKHALTGALLVSIEFFSEEFKKNATEILKSYITDFDRRILDSEKPKYKYAYGGPIC